MTAWSRHPCKDPAYIGDRRSALHIEKNASPQVSGAGPALGARINKSCICLCWCLVLQGPAGLRYTCSCSVANLVDVPPQCILAGRVPGVLAWPPPPEIIMYVPS